MVICFKSKCVLGWINIYWFVYFYDFRFFKEFFLCLFVVYYVFKKIKFFRGRYFLLYYSNMIMKKFYLIMIVFLDIIRYI